MEDWLAFILIGATLVLALSFWVINYGETQKIWRLLYIKDKRIVRIGNLRLLLRVGGGLFLALSGIAPFFFSYPKATSAYTQNIYFLLDVSASMRAQDVFPNRFVKAKEIINILIDSFRGSQLGVIPFSSFAEVYCPLTRDINLLKQIVTLIDIEQFKLEGASFRKGLSKVDESFSRDSISDSKIIIILTDGENNNEHFLSLLSKLQKENYSIFCVCVGTESGAKIPTGTTGEYLRNSESNNDYIVSKTDPNFIASLTTEGKVYTVEDYLSIPPLVFAKNYMKLEEKINYVLGNDGFQVFLFSAIMATIASFFCKPLAPPEA
jgi:Ca-activated chloride channel family protein